MIDLEDAQQIIPAIKETPANTPIERLKVSVDQFRAGTDRGRAARGRLP